MSRCEPLIADAHPQERAVEVQLGDAKHVRLVEALRIQAIAIVIDIPAGVAGGDDEKHAAIARVDGGVIGAGLGYGLVSALQSECKSDGDLVSCTIGPAAGALIASTVLSATGTILVGRAAQTKPSVAGPIAGALVGAVAAVGVDHLGREELRIRTNRLGTGVTVAITQGVLTAIGSRLFSR